MTGANSNTPSRYLPVGPRHVAPSYVVMCNLIQSAALQKIFSQLFDFDRHHHDISSSSNSLLLPMSHSHYTAASSPNTKLIIDNALEGYDSYLSRSFFVRFSYGMKNTPRRIHLVLTHLLTLQATERGSTRLIIL